MQRFFYISDTNPKTFDWNWLTKQYKLQLFLQWLFFNVNATLPEILNEKSFIPIKKDLFL